MSATSITPLPLNIGDKELRASNPARPNPRGSSAWLGGGAAMTEPLPENIRRAGFDALQELSNRLSRGSASLLRIWARLLTDDANGYREVLGNLRRYQGFEMPCFAEVAVIEGALTGLTEPESRALSQRRRLAKFKRGEAARKGPPITEGSLCRSAAP